MCSSLIFSSPDRINLGMAASCNRAISLVNSKYVLLLNDDTKVLRPPFKKLKQVLDVPYVGSFGPWQCVKTARPGAVVKGQQAPITANGVDFHLSTLPNGAGIFAFRKDAWLDVGGFPQVYTNAGDTCFMINLLKHGYFNASMYIGEDEFFTNVDQMAGYEDPTAGKSPLDTSYPHIFGVPAQELAEQSEARRHRLYTYSHHNYYCDEGIVNHSWWHEEYFAKSYKWETHSFDWDVFRFGQEKWRKQVEEDMAVWRSKADGK